MLFSRVNSLTRIALPKVPNICAFQSAYLRIDPRSAHAHEEEAAQGTPECGAGKGNDVVDGPESPGQKTHPDGDQAGHARCNANPGLQEERLNLNLRE